jgi:hypothetical protein
VLATLPDGAELPWGVRQTLTTAGFQVVDTATQPAPDAVLLAFESSVREQDAWRLYGRVEEPADAATSADAARPSVPPGLTRALSWRVRCTTAGCEVLDTTERDGTGGTAP